MRHTKVSTPLGLLCAVAVIAAISTPLELQAQTAEGASGADPSRSGSLFEELARMDSLLFDASFVSCDYEVANAIFADDVEFYHDQTGFQSSEQTRANTKRLTQSCPAERGITRTVVEGSLSVYPIKDYGAVQIGVHRFDERGAPTFTVAQFVHLWHLENGMWRLARVLSFDHHPEQSGADAKVPAGPDD